jgi:hypothetical protein
VVKENGVLPRAAQGAREIGDERGAIGLARALRLRS